MDWDDLRHIRALAAAGTLGGAAERLGTHQTTVYRRIGRIEAALGVRLFERHREGFSLTPAGEEAAATAERLGGEVEALERRIAGRDTRPTGVVRLTTTDTLMETLLGRMLAGFRQRYPGISLEVVVGNPYLSLSRRDADIALRPTVNPPETLVGRRVADVATAIYGSESYLRDAPPIDDVSGHDWVGPDESLAHLASARWMRSELPSVAPVLRCNSLNGVLAACRGGLGLAALPCFLGDQAAQLVRVREPLPELTVGLWLLTHRDLRRVARIRALLDHLHEAFADCRSTFAGTASK